MKFFLYLPIKMLSMKKKFFIFSLFLGTPFFSKAQMGSIIAPTQVSYGISAAWQPEYASGFGLTSRANISLIDFLAKDREKPGFRIRDVWGGHISLGARMHPNVPRISTGPIMVKGPIWYDTGFDLGLQTLFGFSKEVWLSFKGQIVFSFNNAAYHEHPFPTAYSSKILTGGFQAGPIGIEIGKGWAANKHGPNFFTIAGSFELNEKPGKSRLIGIRYTQHGFREATSTTVNPSNGTLEPYFQKNYFFSLFYAFCI
jgi:hypothetical protein